MLSKLKNIFGKKNPHFFYSAGGFNADFWSRETFVEKWKEFEEIGPEYALPVKHHVSQSRIPECVGSLYIAIYPKAKFENLIHFEIFQFYSSSIQQSLFQSGKIDYDWFYPEPVEEGVDRVMNILKEFNNYPRKPDLTKCIKGIPLPESCKWVKKLDAESWIFVYDKEIFDIRAQTNEGYLTAYVVDD